VSRDLAYTSKIVTVEDAVAIVRHGDTVATSGFVGVGTPDGVISALERRFLDTGSPRDLTLVFAAAPGDGGDKGLNRLAHEGLVRRVIGGHFGLVPKLARMATEGTVEAYNLPLGCISQLFREIAGRRAGLVSKVGLRTFVDPRESGGKLNSRTTEDLVELLPIKGDQWMFYKSFPINVAILRGTTADSDGNVTMEREALTLDSLAIAMAAKNSKGLVIVQVERIAAAGSLNPRDVKIPGALVDCIVVAGPEHHAQTYATFYNPAFSGEVRAPVDRLPPLPLDGRKVIARRCAFELPLGGIVNLGIGMPEGVAAVAAEEKLLEYVTLTAEPGIIGGLPQGGLDFGAAVNPGTIIDQNQQFDFYDGGGLDLACLGLAQADKHGNVNVSLFGGRLAGAGGFINISQNARKLIFVGTFSAGGLKIRVADGQLTILQEGRSTKFVDAVEHVTFSGGLAAENRQPVLFVTERCVFRLTEAGSLQLLEVAPGVDVERDILSRMAFRPEMPSDPKTMDGRLFQHEPMRLDELLLARPLKERFTLDSEAGVLYIDLDGYRVRTRREVEDVREAVASRVGPLGRRVAAVISYDACAIASDIAEDWFAMAADVESRFYSHVSRYTTSAFMRLKLGDALSRREVAPHIFETPHEARAFIASRGEAA
jgi:propionate CoA-transferase